MRARAFALALLFAVGCTETSDDLDPTDGGAATRDAGGPRDAGSGPVDGGPPPDAGIEVCGEAETFLLTVVGDAIIEAGGFEGVVTRLPGDTLRFAPERGAGEFSLLGAVPAAGLARARYHARVEARRPFWTEARLTLRALTDDDGPGALVFVGWSGSAYETLDSDALTYAHLPTTCVATADDCGRTEGRTLEVRTAEERLVAPYGARVEGPNFSAFNGGSSVFVEGPVCPDTPAAWFEGWVAFPETDEVPCDLVPRDACIAEPRCTLWGSELDDPGYRCVDAANACERVVDAEACGRTPGCGWDTGDCYCPEGVKCVCAGGPAPKCRQACSAMALDCGAARYCDETSLLAPDMCGPVPDGAGQCEWIPDTCAGSAGGDVCACGANGAQTFANDCLRRAAQASGPAVGACPP